MTCNVLSAIRKYNMIEKGDVIVVGFSGGADSVCLLHFLSIVKDDYDIVLKAVHVNHNIRGEEAERDENFAREFCQKLGVEFISFSVDVPSLAEERGISEEECGREVRYDCFRKVKCNKIAVAHTLSDSAETLIFNLTRGTGIKGLCGINPVRDNIIRPLIYCSRQDIENYCKKHSLSYVTDSTNLSNDYTRNKIRNEVIPVLKSINPSFEKSISRLINNAENENAFMEQTARKLISDSREGDCYNRAVFLENDVAVIRRAVSLIISDFSHKNAEDKHISLCCDVIKAGNGAVEIVKGLYFVSDNKSFCIKKRVEQDEEEWVISFREGEIETPGGVYSLSVSENFSYAEADIYSYVNLDGVDLHSISLHSRRAGDKFYNIRRKNTKTLKKLFTENKMPKEIRNKICVVSSGDDVLWVHGFGTDGHHIVNGDTKKVLIINKKE